MSVQLGPGTWEPVCAGAGRSNDKKIKARNNAAKRAFRWSHGLLMSLFLIFIYMHGIGIFLFTKGFLLTRMVLEHKSSCEVNPLAHYGGETAKMGAVIRRG